MSDLIRIGGFDEEDAEEVAAAVRSALSECGVSYALMTVEIGNDTLLVVDKDGDVTDGGVARYVQLPPLSQLVKNWKQVLTEVSSAIANTRVTLLVNGICEVAIGGNIL